MLIALCADQGFASSQRMTQQELATRLGFLQLCSPYERGLREAIPALERIAEELNVAENCLS